MAVVDAIVVIAVVGAAAFVMKAVRLKAMAGLWTKRPQPGSTASTDRLKARHRKLAQLPANLQEAHKHASSHRVELLASALCGCVCCCTTFPPQDIEEWTDEVNGEGQTALCPRCGIDSVLGDRAGFELSSSFLQHMNSVWF